MKEKGTLSVMDSGGLKVDTRGLLVMGWERKRGSECPVKGGSDSKNRIHCTNDYRWVSACVWRPPTKMLAEALWVMG